MHAIPSGKPWFYYVSHILALIGASILAAGIFGLVGGLIAQALYGVGNLQEFLDSPDLWAQHPYAALIIQGFAALGFIVPALIYPLLVSQRPLQFHSVTSAPAVLAVFLATVLTLLALNPVTLLALLNDLVSTNNWGELGEWFRTNDEQVSDMQEHMITQKGAGGVALALLVIAILPAIGEELFFRGALQRLFQGWAGVHAGVIITAIVFSAFHLQFSGFLPRLFLGLFLGYLFVWTGNLWFPIIAHFVNNAFIVIVAQFYSPDDLDVEAIGTPDLWTAAFGTLLFAGFAYLFYKYFRKRDGGELGETDDYRGATPG